MVAQFCKKNWAKNKGQLLEIDQSRPHTLIPIQDMYREIELITRYFNQLGGKGRQRGEKGERGREEEMIMKRKRERVD